MYTHVSDIYIHIYTYKYAYFMFLKVWPVTNSVNLSVNLCPVKMDIGY